MIDETLFEAEEKMDKAVEVAKEDFAGIRTGRANSGDVQQTARGVLRVTDPDAAAGLLHHAGGPHHPHQAVRRQGDARHREGDPRQRPRGQPEQRRPVVIRCILPALTEERRRDYIKLAHHKAEEARVAIRNVRRKAKTDLEHLIKDGEVGEDDGAGPRRNSTS
jgi:ribosome recycling factor